VGDVASVTRDRGQSWNIVRGLPTLARAVADRVDPKRFYAWDVEHSRIFSSEDGGASFTPVATRGLSADQALAQLLEQPRRAGTSWPLLATPGQPGDVAT